MRKRSLTAFWPQYFDKTRSRRLGRRIPKKNAIANPLAEDLLKAAQNAGYYAEIDSFRQYPRTWWDEKGLVLVDTMGQKKTFALNKIVPELENAIKNRNEINKKKNTKKKANVKKVKAQEELMKRLKQKQYAKKK